MSIDIDMTADQEWTLAEAAHPDSQPPLLGVYNVLAKLIEKKQDHLSCHRTGKLYHLCYPPHFFSADAKLLTG
jgi:hypothetical protein